MDISTVCVHFKKKEKPEVKVYQVNDSRWLNISGVSIFVQSEQDLVNLKNQILWAFENIGRG